MIVRVTGRPTDLFEQDVKWRTDEIRQHVGSRRILVLGGGGSIGSSTVGLISQFKPAALHVIDQNENALTELVRDLRSRREGLQVNDFVALPIDFASPIMRRFIESQAAYDIVLNFAALKHVRSEKDIFSLLQMFDTNLIKPLKCWEWLCRRGAPPQYFSVSTDKAAAPASLMGASKRLMENIMFSAAMSGSPRITSARFANVAFSSGSLLESFGRRFERLQPLVAPRQTYRFFVSLREAGQICTLAAMCGPDRHIVIPRLSPRTDTRRLEDIAVAFIEWKGFDPSIYDDEESARANLARDLARNRYPLLLTDLDTAGEKACEIFVASGEQMIECGMSSLLAVRHLPADERTLSDFIAKIRALTSEPSAGIEKRNLIELVSAVLPEFHHADSDKVLDQRM
ncbi:MAG TPA: polysaccharide biosynthesis protein [Bryobacteraceae bacterium]|nr:polysaccharide biosynthesis protein [Bryobacteraceae bacterium]